MKRFYKNKKILITGHTGFVGSWLTLWLSNSGAEVIGFSLNPPSKPYLYRILNLEDKITNIRGDIRNRNKVESIIKEYRPEIVMHLAAQPILLKSYEEPINTYLTNVIGTLNLLEANRKNDNLKAILNVTSDKVYENVKQRKGYVEENKLGGYDPYSSSKSCSEIVTNAYKNSFYNEIGVATARAGNIIGGGDWGENRLVPGLVESSINKKRIFIRHPKSIRPWTHIFDILNGYLTLTNAAYNNPEKYSDSWNFSTKYRKSVRDVINEFSKYFKINYKIKADVRHEEDILLLNSVKARRLLGWKSKVGFEEAVRLTAEWYNNFYNNRKDIYEYSVGQLAKFEKGLNG
jgi:CDP-glucose 4,6-dehydratase